MQRFNEGRIVGREESVDLMCGQHDDLRFGPSSRSVRMPNKLRCTGARHVCDNVTQVDALVDHVGLYMEFSAVRRCSIHYIFCSA